ncbi:MAG: hypothetical protein IT370_05460 [Deltaproteobacteria bacterium]|nr:hypothetical protein [Deltaproteobacteria bacterium]
MVKRQPVTRGLLALALALVLLVAIGCSSSEDITIDLVPTTRQVIAGGTVDFDATITVQTSNSIDVKGDNSVFDWSVVEAGGGTVTANGVYTAPLTTGVFHVKATSKEHPSHSATATITVMSP